MTVVDPFAGVALGALDAMWHGLNWVGCELEPKFCALAEKNIEFWQRRYGSKEGFGEALIFQADSRNLASVIAGADLVCSSPPFVASGAEGDGRKRLLTNAWNADKKNSKHPGWRPNCGEGYQKKSHADSYGSSPGQLGSMKEGDFDCVVGSPPYAGSNQNYADGLKHIDAEKSVHRRDMEGHYAEANYGSSPGQLASLPEGRFEAEVIISSPPYEGSMTTEHEGDETARVHFPGWHGGKASYELAYGKSKGQVGAMQQNTFWSAAREILIQCHTILKPGGQPAPDGEGIDFCDRQD